MTVSFTALGSKTGPAIGAVVQYFCGNAREKYYTEGGEVPGMFLGAGAAALRLAGDVAAWQFTNLLAGLRPNGKELSKRTRKKAKPKKRDKAEEQDATEVQGKGKNGKQKRRERSEGVDLTFGVPKSVSAIWALAPQPLRTAIEEAFLQTIAEEIRWVENNVPLVRHRNGHIIRELGKAVVAAFVHPVDRDLKPHLHAHLIFCPKVQGPDGTWSALNTIALRDWARTLGPKMRQTLATKLQALGLPIVQAVDTNGKVKGWFEIEGVPDALAKAWSPRRNDIEQFFESRGQSIGEVSAIAREYAALITREQKAKTPPRDVLYARWTDEAREHGLTPEKVAALVRTPQQHDVESAFEKAKQEALVEVTRNESSFTWRKLIQVTAEKIQHLPMTGNDIAEWLRHDLDTSQSIVKLGVEKGDELYTTRHLWNIERKLLHDVQELAGRNGITVPAQRIAAMISDRKLEGEQAAAIRTLASSSSAVRCLAGVAGAGKTTVLEPLTRLFEDAGYRVLGTSVAGAAKEHLAAETGMPARTVASYLYHLDQPWGTRIQKALQDATTRTIKQVRGTSAARHPAELTSNTVLIIDEAGMLDTRQTARLIHHVKKAGGTVILTGDTEQLPAIGAGAPFRKIIDLVGESAAALSVNYRQQRAIADREAAHLIRHGESRQALESYSRRGRLSVSENRAECIAEVVQSWAAHGGAKQPTSSMIFTQTRSEARTINRLCQAERQRAGFVAATGLVHEGQTYCKGDRILFHKAIHSQGIENGFGATILKVKSASNSLVIRLDNPPSAAARAKGAMQFTTVSLDELPTGGLSLFYSCTTHKLQGQSVDKAFLVLGGRMTDREMTYVQTTRGRHGTFLFVDAINAGEELTELAKSLERSHRKELAHDVAERTKVLPNLERERVRERHAT